MIWDPTDYCKKYSFFTYLYNLRLYDNCSTANLCALSFKSEIALISHFSKITQFAVTPYLRSMPPLLQCIGNNACLDTMNMEWESILHSK